MRTFNIPIPSNWDRLGKLMTTLCLSLVILTSLGRMPAEAQSIAPGQINRRLLPDLVITQFGVHSTPFQTDESMALYAAWVVVKNLGEAPAKEFTVAIEGGNQQWRSNLCAALTITRVNQCLPPVITKSDPYSVPFTTETGDGWEALSRIPLAAGAFRVLSGYITLDPADFGRFPFAQIQVFPLPQTQTQIRLDARVDPCHEDTTESDDCRVEESNETNNTAGPVWLKRTWTVGLNSN